MEWLLWASANLLPGDAAGWFYFWAFIGSMVGSIVARFHEQ